MKATDICARAAELVGGDRDRQHGAKARNFQNIATLWQAWLSIRKDEPLTGHDVGIMMALMKAARTQSGDFNEDDLIDAVGYLSCAGEILASEEAILHELVEATRAAAALHGEFARPR